MTDFDVFNGDADGLCALHQLRLAEPRQAELITGVKRDVLLLKRVNASAGDRVTVLDISLAQNRAPLNALLERGARIDYFDHHHAGDVPRHSLLTAYIDTDPAVCTSLIVDRHLNGRFRAWAVVAAFGDNLGDAALRLATPLGLPPEALEQLRQLGECLNYNSYGETLADLYYPPTKLYRSLHDFVDPLAFIAERPEFDILLHGIAADMREAWALQPADTWPGGAVYILPDAIWSRRLVGILANRLDLEFPERAHAVLLPIADGYRISIRLPHGSPLSADALCGNYPGGGGRVRAAGINRLASADLKRFLNLFRDATLKA